MKIANFQKFLWNVNFYNVFGRFASELFVLHYVFTCQFQTGQFLQCFWGETAATCFLQWIWRSFYSTEKLSFTKSFSCLCDLCVLNCSLYIMFLRNAFWNVAFTSRFLYFNRSEFVELMFYTMFLRFPLFDKKKL